MVIIAQFYKKLIFFFFIFHFRFQFFLIFLFDNIPLKNIFSASTKSQFNSNSINSCRSFLSQLQIILKYTLVFFSLSLLFNSLISRILFKRLGLTTCDFEKETIPLLIHYNFDNFNKPFFFFRVYKKLKELVNIIMKY